MLQKVSTEFVKALSILFGNMHKQYLKTFLLNVWRHVCTIIADMFTPMFEYIFTPSLKTSLHDAWMHYVMQKMSCFKACIHYVWRHFHTCLKCISSYLQLLHIFVLVRLLDKKPFKMILKCACYILNLHAQILICNSKHLLNPPPFWTTSSSL